MEELEKQIDSLLNDGCSPEFIRAYLWGKRDKENPQYTLDDIDNILNK